MQTSAAIEARDLTKTYGKDVRALDGLGFEVELGDPEPNGRASAALDRVPGVWEVTIVADSYVDFLTPGIVRSGRLRPGE